MEEWNRRVEISTHSLTKRLTEYFCKSHDQFINFNSQPHEEADVSASFTTATTYISTHSLTKRLTKEKASEAETSAFQLTASRRG